MNISSIRQHFQQGTLLKAAKEKIVKQRYQTSSFTSPIFAGKINYLNIYEESLTKFQQKCDIRDYLDMSQTLNHIAKNNIPGDRKNCFTIYSQFSGFYIVLKIS